MPYNWIDQHVPRLNDKTWNGDCWKLALQLNDSKGIEFFILGIDFGVGVVKKISNEFQVPDFSEELQSSQFEKFVSIVHDLPVISFAEGINKLF